MSDRPTARELMLEGTAVDAAFDRGLEEAVRAHRRSGEPLIVWADDEMREVSPFDITLPGEELPPAPPRRRAAG
jgi:hypothetical protein